MLAAQEAYKGAQFQARMADEKKFKAEEKAKEKAEFERWEKKQEEKSKKEEEMKQKRLRGTSPHHRSHLRSRTQERQPPCPPKQR